MLSSLNKKYPFNDNLKINVRTIASVSLGIFLFLLFFQPFNIQNPDFNDRLIILSTFGAITLVLQSLFRLVIPSVFSKAFSEERWTILKEIIIDLLFVISNSVAFTFFAKYVGHTAISFHVVINIVIISITAAVVLVVINQFYLLKKQVKELAFEEEESTEKNVIDENTEVEFESENKSEYFHLFLQQILLIKSANNYIEVIYKLDGKINKKLIRNTLKNTEKVFLKYPSMVRCHRSCIINKNHIQKVTKGNYGLVVELFDYPEKIHVSRQYVLKVKEALRTK
ncbi:LytTR family transcriptional regulator DNA-binding domain-containing protein [Prolixibacteraceae bacterium Z1-6]|uniref:LytTR family transcriptional regulator DNA-binding domain-containing protein n=1 Tax=Draconibacterium aestuarii TaxID=2998507 RepID=A0A9X3J4R0_9BACT|nr:LytTR family transcriptional regulator DNA-binding domain-containing protein [Prolixibacteraceae bacterium Z1-6]